MANSKIGGMSFCNVSINNNDGDIRTYKLLDTDRPSSPTMTYRDYVVPGRHGSRRYDDRYEDIIIKVVIGVSGNSIEKQNKITQLLRQWIGQEGKLIFNDRPRLFYTAKFFDSCTPDNEGIFTKLTITFIASFCMYELNYDETDFTDELPVRATITNTGTAATTNYGNFECNPIVEISGTATLAIITVNDTQFSVANISDAVFIDTENMIVYTIANGKKVSKLTDFQGLFPKIKIGENTITVGGTNVNTITKVKYRNTYIC